MKKTIFVAMLMAVIGATPALADKLSVVAGILPVQYFVEQIGGTFVETTVLVEPGADPHTYEPKPSQMRALAEADMFFTIGIAFETNWTPRFKSANKDLRVFRLDRGIKKMPMEAHDHHGEGGHHDDHAEHHDHAAEHHAHAEKHHGHGEEHHGEKHHDHAGEHHGEEEHGHHHGGMDPHVWTSPLLVKQIAGNILSALVKVDPAHEAAYRANHDAFVVRVDALHRELGETFHSMGHGAEFMVYHPAWGYFAKDYHLKQISVEMEGKAPGPRQLAELIKHAKEHDIKVVFVQPQFSERAAQTIAGEINGQVVKIDPLARDWFDNMRSVGRAFRAALAQ